MRRSPVVNLEFALLGDGVPVAEIYDVLSTSAGRHRPGVRQARHDQGRCRPVGGRRGAATDTGGRRSGDVDRLQRADFNAQTAEEHPFVIVWAGQLLDTGYPAT